MVLCVFCVSCNQENIIYFYCLELKGFICSIIYVPNFVAIP